MVFDMILSLLVAVVVFFKHRNPGFIPGTGLNTSNFQAASGWTSSHTGPYLHTDRDGT
jgi:hypothetical protein